MAYRFEYADGLKATMLLVNGLVEDFTFAAKLKGKRNHFRPYFICRLIPTSVYSAALMSRAEEMFLSGKCRTRSSERC